MQPTSTVKTTIMKLRSNLIIAALLAASASTAFSQSGLTRAQVQAELQEAIRTGELIHGERGETLREMYPGRYPPKAQAPGKSREQVQAELREAIATGNVIDNSDTGLLRNQVRPDLYPAQLVASGKTRAEVRAELEEAIRTGDVLAHGDRAEKLNELYPHLYPKRASAGRRFLFDEVGTR